MSTVIVFCPNARQHKVQVAPGKPMKEVLTEACLQQGYDADIYGLQFQRKFIDLSLPFRLSGLPNNAHLELIEKPTVSQSPVKIALQTPHGRFESEFAIECTIWEVLEAFQSSYNVNLLSFDDVDTVPAVSFMQKTFKGQMQLSQTTLKAMGIEGRVLFRYLQIKLSPEDKAQLEKEIELNKLKQEKLEQNYLAKKNENEERLRLQKKFEDEVFSRTEEMRIRQTESPAQINIPTPSEVSTSVASIPTASSETSRLNQLQSVLSTLSDSLSEGRVDDLADRLLTDTGRITLNPPPPQPLEFINFKFPDKPVATVGDLLKLEKERGCVEEEVEIPERHALVFSPEPRDVDMEVDESFFDLTVEDAKRLQKELREEVRRSNQQSLLPASFIENRNKQKKKNAYKNTVIRIKLAEKIIIQARFTSTEPVQNLFKFVNQVIRWNEFELIAVLKIDKESKRDLIDEGLAPKSTLTVQWKGVKFTEDLINYDVLSRVSESEADSDVHEWLSANSNYSPDQFLVDGMQSSEAGTKRNYDGPINKSPNSGPSLPKWLKKF
ncbi:unnamed protein product [Bursaphelenchus xylophilus]|uniref:(pine wood nematode) hypothetical protein n=1 Tax=Bursaphelenchus xylophilus TaxID=6326 RepID=A0A1I7RRT9_BURXY|nr:unnamed protein product [Bursaphelenchus xylophilus]CAG9123480.1 unnamed protein product [Bursaphelenchus xylophilus]